MSSKAAESVTAYLTGQLPPPELDASVGRQEAGLAQRLLEYLAVHGPTVQSSLAVSLGVDADALIPVVTTLRSRHVLSEVERDTAKLIGLTTHNRAE